MNMYSWALVILVTSLSAMLCAAALIKPEPVPRTRVYRVPPQWPDAELEPFPGWEVVTHNELDQFARHYQGLSR